MLPMDYLLCMKGHVTPLVIFEDFSSAALRIGYRICNRHTSYPLGVDHLFGEGGQVFAKEDRGQRRMRRAREREGMS